MVSFALCDYSDSKIFELFPKSCQVLCCNPWLPVHQIRVVIFILERGARLNFLKFRSSALNGTRRKTFQWRNSWLIGWTWFCVCTWSCGKYYFCWWFRVDVCFEDFLSFWCNRTDDLSMSFGNVVILDAWGVQNFLNISYYEKSYLSCVKISMAALVTRGESGFDGVVANKFGESTSLVVKTCKKILVSDSSRTRFFSKRSAGTSKGSQVGINGGFSLLPAKCLILMQFSQILIKCCSCSAK